MIKKKLKIENIYTSRRWKKEDDYEILSVRQMIRNEIFKHAKFCKGECIIGCATHFERKDTTNIEFGNSHEK